MDAGCAWDARCASQDLTSARQDPVNQVAWSVSKIQGWLKARARAASLARSAFGPVGHEDAAGLCKKSWATMFYNLSDFDLEDLLEEKSGQDATWRAIQTAPALFQQAHASVAAHALQALKALRLAD